MGHILCKVCPCSDTFPIKFAPPRALLLVLRGSQRTDSSRSLTSARDLIKRSEAEREILSKLVIVYHNGRMSNFD